jgi:hypothetical protein
MSLQTFAYIKADAEGSFFFNKKSRGLLPLAERKIIKMIKRKWVILLSTVFGMTQIPIPVYAAWEYREESNWIFEENQTYESSTWKLIDNTWYYFDQSGNMTTGWQLINEKWYFFNPVSDGTKGKMLTGWQWIDGKCYFLSLETEATYPEGAMYANGITPDGYSVNASGAWQDETGTVQYVPGKGIQTVIAKKETSTTKVSGGGSSGGGSGGKGSNSKPDSGSKPTTPGEGESETEPGIPVPVEPEEKEKQYGYTVRYVDVKDKTVLQAVAGTGVEGETIAVIQPVIEDYKLCEGQKKSFRLTSDHMILNIYYEKESVASPSEARKVDWKLYFIEKGNPGNEILKAQEGRTEEGKALVIDFPETILGVDRYSYHSLVSSPWSIIVNGNGTQKYYIEFERGNHLPEEVDPDQEAKGKLEKWLEISKAADSNLGGREPSYQQLITKSIAESNERLLNLVSMADGTGRKEVYLIAKGHVPNTIIVSQTFQDIHNLSELVMDEFTIAYEEYAVIRVGFEKIYEESTCSHDYQVTDRVNVSCTANGHETVRCRRCGKEETVMLPATGHVDADYDGVCEICYRFTSETLETVHYSIGDVQARTIGGRIYLFRCIDEDYEDAMGNTQTRALFLCESLIRSDVDGPAKKLSFGFNNNYKNSNIRQWLLEHVSDDFIEETYIGITRSYIGATQRGRYEQLEDNSLLGRKEVFQFLQDKVFILSVEEALKYRDALWKFDGSEINNPESQVSAYSKGYYLRTPQDNGGWDDFLYGEGIYAVSLEDGNIQPVSVKETAFGIRPVMAILQG